MPLHVFARRHAIDLFEAGGESGDGFETRSDTYIGDVEMLGSKEFGSLRHADAAQEIAWCLSREVLDFTVEMHTRNAHLICNEFNIQFRIGNILVHHLHHSFHQVFVCRQNFHIVNLFLGLLFRLEFSLDNMA